MLPTFLALRRILAASLFLLHARGEGDLRLVNGFIPSEGRVEIFYDGQWGTICDDRWGISDAHVVCQQLGLGYAEAAFGKGNFGRGIGPIAMDEVKCIGDEERLDQCPFRGWFSHNCVHQEDAGVRCSTEDGGLRLVSGKTQYEGRIEVFYGGTWGTVCDDGWDINDAMAVCRQLGLGPPVMATRGALYGKGTGEILLFRVNCEGTENGLEECGYSGFLTHNCTHNQDAGVLCSALDTPPTSDICNNYDVRLLQGPMESGLVEVCYKDNWGTVCANSWKKEEAITVCKQLGYNTPETFLKRKTTSMVPTQIVEYLSCRRDEISLSNCDITFGNPRNCTFDAVLSCSGEPPELIMEKMCTSGRVRLIDSERYYTGKVQICESGHWLDICGSSFEDSDSAVICQQLGYKSDKYSVFQLPTVTKKRTTVSIICSGTEKAISECKLTLKDKTNCVQRVNLKCKPGKFRFLIFDDAAWYWRTLLVGEVIIIYLSGCANICQCWYRKNK